MGEKMPRSRTSTAEGRIVITGTGRAGTTFLVQLFTVLEFDTGFSRTEALVGIDGIACAGLERKLLDDANPYVIKSPGFADHLMTALEARRIKIRVAIVPMRDLFDAAESRRRVFRLALKAGHDPLSHPGSLIRTHRFDEEEWQLARQFYDSIFPLVRFNIPVVLLYFPRLVQDPDYLFRALNHIMAEHGVDRSTFVSAFADVSRPEVVHDFSAGDADTMRLDRGVRLRVLLNRLRAKARRTLPFLPD